MRLRQFFYLSRPTAAPTEPELERLLQISQRNNRQGDITGCLLYTGRHYAQILEGEADAVAALVERIAGDPRHGDLTVVADQDIALRSFPDWSMGFLYKLDVVDRIEAVLGAEHVTEEQVLALMADMRTDSVLGSL